MVIPLHKKSDIHDINNYKGITLLSVLAKLFTMVIYKRLNNWANTYGIILECQAGFRKGYGTVLHSVVSHMLN